MSRKRFHEATVAGGDLKIIQFTASDPQGMALENN